MKIGMAGCGKLGLLVALTIESRGHEVKGYDPNPAVAGYLKDRAVPFKEEHSEELLKNTKMEMVPLQELVDWADILFLAPQTPHAPEYEGATRLPDERVDFDYTYLKECVREVSECLHSSKTCVIISTVLPGTLHREILPGLNPCFDLVYEPLFIAMGTVYHDFLNPEFVLVGVKDERPAQKLEEFYKTIHNKPVFNTDIRTAEGIKVFYNTFITAKTVLANLYGEMSHRLGMNVDDIYRAISLSTNRLISSKYLRAGMGDGGGCLPAGELVITENGPRPIETVKVGDQVLAGDGKLHPVVKVWEREYSGDLLTLRTEGVPTARFTGDHHVFACSDGRHVCPGGKRDTRLSAAAKLEPMREIEARELVVGDFIPQPKPEGDQVSLPDYVSPAYCELAGWYLSEGSLEVNDRRGRIRFDLHARESLVAERLAYLLVNLSPPKQSGRGAGADSVIKTDGNSLSVRYGSKELAWKLFRDFGKGAATKTVPSWVVYGPEDVAKRVMKGLWQGDGHRSEFGMFLSTTSIDIAYAAYLILARFGIAATLRDIPARVGHDGQKHHRAWEVRVRNARDYERMAELTGLQRPPIKDQKLYERFPVRDYTYRKLTGKESEPFTGKVWNLWIDCEQHTFTTNIGFVSNCHPRDNIALSYIARKSGLSFDFFDALMKARENHCAWQASLIQDEVARSIFVGGEQLDVFILGESFKPETNIRTGSPALLLSNILKERGIEHGIGDDLVPYKKAIYFIGTMHDRYKDYEFPQGSVVIDPFRYLPKQDGVRYVQVGKPESAPQEFAHHQLVDKYGSRA